MIFVFFLYICMKFVCKNLNLIIVCKENCMGYFFGMNLSEIFMWNFYVKFIESILLVFNF